jgi:hypothetical protein
MKKNILRILLVMFLTTGCGFKIVNQAKLINYSITKIETTGDKRINYNLKNSILSSFKNDKEKKIVLNIETKKNKSIKEKNIKNEITKYHINIISKIKIKNENLNIKTFQVTKSGDYNVSTQHSETLNNEKKLIRLLSNNLAEDIVEEILIRLNDI